jgi:predicted nucleic-acid-binding protein
MRAVDTNVLVRVLARDNPSQAASADRFIAGGAWVSHLVLVEAVWVLGTALGLRAPAVADAIQMVLDHQDLSVEAPDVVAAALVEFRNRPGLGFTDCLVLELARKAGHLPLGTFDQKLAKLDGTQRL